MKNKKLFLTLCLTSCLPLYGMHRQAGRSDLFEDVELGDSDNPLLRFYDTESKMLRGSSSEIFDRGICDIFAWLKDFVVGHQLEQVVITDYSFVSIEREQLKVLLGQLVQLQLASPQLKTIKLLVPDAAAGEPSRATGVVGALVGGLQAELPGLLQVLLLKEDESSIPAQKLGVQVIELGGAQVPIILVPQAGAEATVKTIQMGKATVIMLVYPVPASTSRGKVVAVAALMQVISIAATALTTYFIRQDVRC